MTCFRGAVGLTCVLTALGSDLACAGRSRTHGDGAAGPSAGASAGGAGSGLGGMGGMGAGGAATAGACASAVSFRLTSANPAAYCWDGCALYDSLYDSEGASVRWVGCNLPDCATCDGQQCLGAKCGAQPFTADGFTFTWDGMAYQTGACSDGSSCWARGCAATGQYHAKLCATVALGDGSCPAFGMGEQSCAELDFDYPTTGELSLVLP